jgi:acyl-CoA thioester hydrolase
VRSHRLTRRVHFYETDMAGIVHFSCFFRYMEEAEHALWREAGLTIVPRDRDVGFPRVAASCEYLAPLRFEDEFQVDIQIAALNRRTIKYECVIASGDTRIATGSLTTVCVRHAPGTPLRAVDSPEEIVARLK